MRDDDEDAPKSGPLKDLAREDLDPLSVEDLEDRIRRLDAEIARARTAINAKQSHRSAAETFFKAR
jgi:uncharacterized small protein (DUF1192 family)